MNELLEKEKTILEVISDIFIFIMILVFPLMVDSTGFFHILECKWYSFVTIAGVYIGITILVILYFLIFKKINYFKIIKLSIVHYLAITFLGVNIISCFTSPFFKSYDLFIGVGRGEGLIVSSLYILIFLFVSLFAKFKIKYLAYFSISSILINSIAILQYIGFNPFNMYQNGIGTHNVSFMATIGNVDFISAIYCMLLPVSFCSFVFLENEKKYMKTIHLLSVLMGFFILGIIDVQSGKVAILGTLVLILPFIISSNKRLSRAVVMLATILMSYCINIIINPEYHYNLQRLDLYFQFNYFVVLFIIVCAFLMYLASVLYKTNYDISKNKKIIKNFYLGLIGCGLLGLIVVYSYDFKSGMLYEVHELLHGNFDDDFGTYRVFLWKRTVTLIPQFPILGSGPDTFAIRFMAKFTNDIASIGPLTLNDTAANIYLTMIINLGIVGLLNYLTFIFFQIKRGLKNMNCYSSVLLIAIICYLIQSFFNLSVVIVSPIFWILMALHYNSVHTDSIDTK